MNEITEEQIELIVNAVRGGTDLDTASHYAGINNTLVYRWLERGKIESDLNADGRTGGETEQPYLNLWDQLKKARADSIVRNVAYIQKAAKDGTWQAAAWYLERANPEQYGKRREERQQIPAPDRKEVTE